MRSDKDRVLADLLVRTGRLSAEEIQAVSGEGGLGDRLVAADLLSPAELEAAKKERRRRVRRCNRCGTRIYIPPPHKRASCPKCPDGSGAGARLPTQEGERGAASGSRERRSGMRPPAQPFVGQEDQTLAEEAGAWGSGESESKTEGVSLHGKHIGGYVLGRELSRGAMGIVFLAYDEQMSERVVALKVMRWRSDREPQVDRFVEEAKMAARLDHPHIVRVHRAGFDQGYYYYSMDYIEGETMDRRVRQTVAADPKLLAAMVPICEAVQHAHERGIIHRDLKLANVMLDAQGSPRITDFGLARVVARHTRLTQTGELIGTPLYMAPEQVRGQVDRIDERTDVYALGVMLFRILSRTYPFPGRSIAEIYDRILTREASFPEKMKEEIPEPLQRIALKAMAKRREERYPSVADMVADLKAFFAGDPISLHPPTVADRVKTLFSRHRRRIAQVAVVVLLLILTATVWQAVEHSTTETAIAESNQQFRNALASRVDGIRRRLETSRTMLEGTVDDPDVLAGAEEALGRLDDLTEVADDWPRAEKPVVASALKEARRELAPLVQDLRLRLGLRELEAGPPHDEKGMARLTTLSGDETVASPLRARANRRLALLHLDRERVDVAEQHARQLLKTASDDPDGLWIVAETTWRRDARRGAALYESLIRTVPPEAHLQRGVAFLRTGRDGRAREELLFATDSTEPVAIRKRAAFHLGLWHRAQAEQKTGPYEAWRAWGKALKRQEEALALDPKFARAERQRGFCHEALGNWRLAVSDLKRTWARRSEPAIGFRVGRLLLLLGRHNEAESTLKAVSEMGGDSGARALHLLAFLADRGGRTELARERLQKAADAASDAELLLRIGQLSLRVPRLRVSIPGTRINEATSESGARGLAFRAEEALVSGSPERAERLISKALYMPGSEREAEIQTLAGRIRLPRSPDRAERYFSIGRRRFRKGRTPAAALHRRARARIGVAGRLFRRQQIQKRSRDPAALQKERERFEGLLDRAVDDLDLAFFLAPGRSLLWTERARIHRFRGEMEAAEEAADKAISLDPTLRDARLLRAEIRLLRNDPAGAARDLAAATPPDDRFEPRFLRLRARVLAQQKERSEALAVADRLLAKRPVEAPLLIEIGRRLNLEREERKALRDRAVRELQRVADANRIAERGRQWVTERVDPRLRREDIVALLEKAVTRDPSNPRALFYLGVFKFGKRLYDEEDTESALLIARGLAERIYLVEDFFIFLFPHIYFDSEEGKGPTRFTLQAFERAKRLRRDQPEATITPFGSGLPHLFVELRRWVRHWRPTEEDRTPSEEMLQISDEPLIQPEGSGLEHLDRFLHLRPDSGTAYLLRGFLRQSGGQIERARKDFELAGALAPDSLSVHLGRATSLTLFAERLEDEKETSRLLDDAFRHCEAVVREGVPIIHRIFAAHPDLDYLRRTRDGKWSALAAELKFRPEDE